MRLFIFIFLFCSFSGFSQDNDIIYDDVVYYEDIRSVNIYASGLPTSAPLIELKKGASLTLEFDDMAADVKDYTYEIFHCDASWHKSNLEKYEYYDGFEIEDIKSYNFSRNTYKSYTHYQLQFPNENIQLKLSGNYIIAVFDEDDDHDLVLMRRFMIYESKLSVKAKLITTQDVSKLYTHHEFRFEVDYSGFHIGNPQAEITTSILQNNQWLNAYIDVGPRRLGFNSVVYDYIDSLVFPGIKEFRNFDIRSLRYESSYIQEISEDINKGYSVLLYTDQKYRYKPYVFFKDLNGQFLIGKKRASSNFVKDESYLDIDFTQSLFADYAKVIFSLKSDKYFDKDVYILGELTDWKLDDDYKMYYDESLGIYVTEVLLKQGYYNYEYVLVDKEGNIEYSNIDGASYDAENDYLFLVYYKPFGERYTKLLGTLTFNSLRWRNVR